MSASQLIAFTGAEGPNIQEQAALAWTTADALVGAYCRGRERRGGLFRPGVEEVILMVGSRILANPEQIQVREQIGPYSMFKGAGFTGFTLTELAILNRYRKRAL